MARITVEDCLKAIKNRFELVLLASKRARQLARSGNEALVPWENDKATVVALREIADGKVKKEFFEEEQQTKPLTNGGDKKVIASEAIQQTMMTVDMTKRNLLIDKN